MISNVIVKAFTYEVDDLNQNDLRSQLPELIQPCQQ